MERGFHLGVPGGGLGLGSEGLVVFVTVGSNRCLKHPIRFQGHTYNTRGIVALNTLVLAVLDRRNPTQVFYVVVRIVLVTVVHLWFVVNIWNEVFSDETVYSGSLLFAVMTQTNV